jgi:TonB family protein
MIYVMSTEIIGGDWVGQIIDGRFPLLEWLGESERSSVFLTELPREASRRAVLKLIPAEADAEAQLDLWNRAQALSHPHLMRIFHAGLCESAVGPLLYCVTEFAEENLSQILPERPLTPAEAAEMLPPILDALAYLHAKGFVQADLKPSNFLVVDDQLKLSTDRLQRAGERRGLTSALTIYDAPECATGEISPTADLWALGVTLVEALSQHPPLWQRSTAREPEIPATLPQPYADLARLCLRTDPAQRMTLPQFKASLNASQTGAKSPTAIVRWLALTVGVLVLLAVFWLLVLRTQSSKPAQLEPAQPLENRQSAPATATLPTPAPVQNPLPSTPQGANESGSIVQQVLPDVPAKASATIRGQVEISVRVAVDTKGAVINAEMDTPTKSNYFAKLALQAAQRWRFTPPHAAGRALPSAWVLHFHFTQTSVAVTPVETTP